jgi:hypothetical protein
MFKPYGLAGLPANFAVGRVAGTLVSNPAAKAFSYWTGGMNTLLTPRLLPPARRVEFLWFRLRCPDFLPM